MIDVEARMRELCRPLEQQILMCDNKEDILMMACAMLQHAKTMMDSQIGAEGRKQILEGANND